MEDIILYHGSCGGIVGDIQPISRVRCDFGKGFYMGEYPEQVQGLVVHDSDPVFYTLNLKLSEIPEDKILILDGMEWAYAVLACRDRIPKFSQLQIAKEIKAKVNNADIVIGPIADDRMNVAVARFIEGSLSDVGLLECLRHVDYGRQFVAKTEFACSKIEIISEREIYEKEAESIQKYSQRKRDEGKHAVQQAIVKYRKDGFTLEELIQKETLREGEINNQTKFDNVSAFQPTTIYNMEDRDDLGERE